MRGISSIFIFLILLSACNSEIKAKPLSELDIQIVEPITEDFSCAKIKCAENRICVEGQCVCPENQKICGTGCIVADACCIDSDCSKGKCIENQCVETTKCSYGEVFKDGNCECAEGYKYCEEQEKCIAKDSCCTYLNCPSFQTCVKTTYGVSLCMKNDEKESCRFVSDNTRAELFNLGDGSIRAQAKRFTEASIEFQIGNETLELQPDVHAEFGDLDVWQEEFRVMGGFCRYEED